MVEEIDGKIGDVCGRNKMGAGSVSKCEICNADATIKYRVLAPMERESELCRRFLKQHNTVGYATSFEEIEERTISMRIGEIPKETFTTRCVETKKAEAIVYRCVAHPVDDANINAGYEIEIIAQGRTFGVK